MGVQCAVVEPPPRPQREGRTACLPCHQHCLPQDQILVPNWGAPPEISSVHHCSFLPLPAIAKVGQVVAFSLLDRRKRRHRQVAGRQGVCVCSGRQKVYRCRYR